MVVKLFGAMDLIAAVFFVLAQWSIRLNVAIIIAAYLIIKSVIFLGDLASFIDLIAGVYLLLVVFDVHSMLSLVFAIWLFQKAFFSLFF
ncbi:MAG: hypothetical protein CMH62_02160 [Nanoarchaeota archaeon]|nr:hypothetical protein [Nanoarchaeota archaeon]